MATATTVDSSASLLPHMHMVRWPGMDHRTGDREIPTALPSTALRKSLTHTSLSHQAE